MDRSEDIEQRAAEWLGRRDSGEWTDADEAQLSSWLAQSIAHRVAYLRLEHGWQESLRLNALSNGMPTGSVPPRGHWKRMGYPTRRPSPKTTSHPSALSVERTDAQPAHAEQPTSFHRARAVLAACVLIAVVASVGWYFSARAPDYRTPVGGLAEVPMADGSKVILNTASAISVAVTEKERRVRLERGEAFFDVARDPSRPFIVDAGGKRVVAVGTKFSVRREGNDIRVFVAEGRVRIEDGSHSPAKNVPQPGAAALSESSSALSASSSDQPLLTAGSIARTGGAGILIEHSAPADIENYLSWRTGFLIFASTPLAEAVAEFNRYNEHKISIEDPALGAIRVSGKFRPTNFDGFVRLLESGHGIHLERSGGNVVLSERHAAR